MRELPECYPLREYDQHAKEYVTQSQPFSDRTREAFASFAEAWEPFWPVAFRWAVLFDKFGRTGSERVSAELRQLERELRELVDGTGGPVEDTDLEGDALLADLLADVAG